MRCVLPVKVAFDVWRCFGGLWKPCQAPDKGAKFCLIRCNFECCHFYDV